MKNYIKFICVIFLAFMLFLTGCKKDDVKNDKYYTVDVYDNKDNFLGTLSVKEGDNVDLSSIEISEGYFYTVTDGDIFSVKEDITITVTKTLFKKEVKYIIDGETVSEFKGKYFDVFRSPEYDNSKIENDTWKEELNITNDTYYYTYTLTYDKKTKYNVSFYDGDSLVDVGISSFKSDERTILPTYTKDGYVFLGWFLNDISLFKVEDIKEGTEVDYKLYARMAKITNDFKLEEANGHFTSIRAVPNGDLIVYQPVMPSGLKSSSPMDYDWYTSDEKVFLISSFSSMSIASSGYAILTAKLKTDPTYIVNAIVKTDTVNGISVVSEDVANTSEFVTVRFVGKDDELIEEQKVLKGNFAYLPTPPTYNGLGFIGWDKPNYNINSDVTFKAMYSDSVINKYAGHTISLIGDSISTFKTYIPSGYSHFYPYPTADVNDVNMTWWMQAFNKVGAKLFVNDSYSGTCVIGGTEPSTKDSRLAKLVIDHKYADFTLIFMGSNDCSAANRLPVEYGPSKFEENYRIMLDKINILCPNTTMVLCTLPVSSLYTNENRILFNDIIRKLANEYKLDLVELNDVNLTDTSNGRLLVDSAHPNKKGMDLIANKVMSELLKNK